MNIQIERSTKLSYPTRYNNEDASGTAGGILAAWIIGIVVSICLCVACCFFLIKRSKEGGENTVVVLHKSD